MTKNKSLISLIIIILIISISDLIFNLENKNYLESFYSFFACITLLTLPLYFFRNNFKIYLLIITPILLLSPINLGSILTFQVPFNDSTLELLLNTNIKESYELLYQYIPIIIITTIIFSYFIYALFKYNENKIQINNLKLISFLSLIGILLIPILEKDFSNYKKTIVGRYYSTFPTTVIYALNTIYKKNKLMNRSEKTRSTYKFDAKIEKDTIQKNIHVLIIGESSRFDNWGLNGYKRNTNPRLSKRKNLISFSNTAAGGFITEFSVPLLLTGVGANNYEDHFKRKSIVSIYNEVNFKTHWISNQIDQGNIQIHSKEATNIYNYFTSSLSEKNVTVDMNLVKKLKTILDENDDNDKFIVLHTQGSHYNYSVRHPNEYDFFKPSLKTVFAASADKNFKKEITNSYDNSILYTDAVIDSVITLLESKNINSSVTYISDHGENLFDDERNFSQHAQPVPSKYIAHIPFIIWYSDKLKSTFPDKITNLNKNINAKISSENLIHTLSSLSGIKYRGQDSTKDLTTKYYIDNLQLILGANNKVYKTAELR